MIGATTIDLENRWFGQEWLDLGQSDGAPPKRPIELRVACAGSSRKVS